MTEQPDAADLRHFGEAIPAKEPRLISPEPARVTEVDPEAVFGPIARGSGPVVAKTWLLGGSEWVDVKTQAPVASFTDISFTLLRWDQGPSGIWTVPRVGYRVTSHKAKNETLFRWWWTFHATVGGGLFWPFPTSIMLWCGAAKEPVSTAPQGGAMGAGQVKGAEIFDAADGAAVSMHTELYWHCA